MYIYLKYNIYICNNVLYLYMLAYKSVNCQYNQKQKKNILR